MKHIKVDVYDYPNGRFAISLTGDYVGHIFLFDKQHDGKPFDGISIHPVNTGSTRPLCYDICVNHEITGAYLLSILTVLFGEDCEFEIIRANRMG